MHTFIHTSADTYVYEYIHPLTHPHTQNTHTQGDLLRFWRQGGGMLEGGAGVGVGYEAATKCYVERLQRFEQEGMAPQILWQVRAVLFI
jgi:hypothetical protein